MGAEKSCTHFHFRKRCHWYGNKMTVTARCSFLVLLLYASGLTNAAPLAGTDPSYMKEMEASMARILRQYVELENSKLQLLSKHADRLEARSKIHDDSEVNPIAMYRMVETLVEEWSALYGTMNATVLPTLLESNPPTPQFQDLTEIATAIFRIQDVYQLGVDAISNGAVPGLDTSGSFSARDCFNLGGMAFSKNDYYHALMWFQEALYRYATEDPPTIDKMEILPLLVVSMDKKGNRQWAKKLALEFDKKARRKKVWEVIEAYPDLSPILEEAAEDEWINFDALPPVKNERLDWYDTTEQPRYEFLCRQEYQKEIPQANLTYNCYYDHQFPYLLLGPAKVEPLRSDPPVMIFRDIISDEEIEVIKSIVREKMVRSRVSESNVTGIVLSSARESFTGWLEDQDHPVVARVRKRAGIFTKLDMASAEFLQVSQYGIGGHYGPHYDHATREDRNRKGFSGSFNPASGDRIATLMFYLAEPEYGGGTAFPYANLVVKPTKHDAIFWFNIRPSGNGDYNTLHAGCPIISGSKWVANQWIKERGQEFVRPCTLIEE